MGSQITGFYPYIGDGRVHNAISISYLLFLYKVMEKGTFTLVILQEYDIYKRKAITPLQFKTFKIEKWNLKLQKEREMFWRLEIIPYLCKKLEIYSLNTQNHDW